MKKIWTTLLFWLILLIGYSQNTQTVKGRIIDEASKQPLAGVLVQLIGSDTLKKGAVSDEQGYFKIENVPLGRQTFKVSFTGYEDKVFADIMVTAGKEVYLNADLQEDLSEIESVTVSYDRKKDGSVTNNEYTTLSARAFNTEETKRYAGALGDPSRMAANYAGVISGNDSRNDIVVRGNSPTGMLWQMEGLNIPNPNHFSAFGTTGGPVSMLNNNVLAKSDFITSAFPAQYGNGNAGVFDLRLRDGNTDKHEFVGQIGFNGFEVGAEGPFSKNYKGSFLINYRYSTLSLFNTLGINFGTGNATPNYQDINLKINLPVGKKGKFTLFSLAGMSDVSFLGNKEDTTKNNLFGDENSNTIVNFKTGILGASYEHQISPKTFAKLTFGIMGTEQRFLGDSISVITREEFRNGEAKFSTQKYATVFTINHKLNAKNSFQAGINVDFLNFNLFNKDIFGGGVSEAVRIDIADNTTLSQGYVQWKHRFSPLLTLNTGAHWQHYSLNSQHVVEPRVGLKYLVTPKQSLSIGYGLHSQIQSIYSSYVITPTVQGTTYTNKNLDFTRSHHAVLGYENNLADKLVFRAEAYYQSLFDVPVEQRATSFSTLNTGADFAPVEQDSLVNNGTGYNYGVEMTIERSFKNNYYFLITGSIFDSKYKGSDGIERNTAFNTNYVLNVLAGKEWKLRKNNVLIANIKVSTVGGRFFTPLNIEASKSAGEAVYDNEKAFSVRQTPYFRTDIKVGYRKDYKKSSLEFSLDLQNLTNNQNIFQQTYNRRTNALVNQYQQGFFPVPFVRYTF
jgi:hypothetical protein